MPKATAKRSACDRCRAKRVRCPSAEEENSRATCARCVRAGVACTTASPGYPGRPRKTPLVDHGSTPSDSATTPVVTDIYNTLPEANLKGWLAVGDASIFGFPSTEEHPPPDSFPTLEQLTTSPRHQELLDAPDSLDMTYAGQNFNNMLDVSTFDTFFNTSGCLSSTTSDQPPREASLQAGFGERMKQRKSAMGAFLSDPRNTVENCAEIGGDTSMVIDNPVAIALTCTKQLIGLIRNVTTATRQHAPSDLSTHDDLLVPADVSSLTAQTESLSTETTLLIISGYLSLMRFYDSLFHDASRTLSHMPPETFKSIKFKSVFRIAGISSLQDISGKAYAMLVIEVIQTQIQTLERCMGLPPAYCISGEAAGSLSSKGIFADQDRARLLHSAMAQKDIKSHRGSKSLTELIRENMTSTMACFSD
ncbi:hypothetical protein PG994_003073 [Apiospora phragmitis]|uniref:Zn(2)-C6 fungal-type domain-containing protein n=1 Tax=Apiospora phragmitis TaxID=2905665 RepID=A0ABR1W9S6_9PEZI